MRTELRIDVRWGWWGPFAEHADCAEGVADERILLAELDFDGCPHRELQGATEFERGFYAEYLMRGEGEVDVWR